jgi:Sigma-70, region 4
MKKGDKLKRKKGKTAERSLIRAKRKGARPKTKLSRRLTKEEKKLSVMLDPWMHETLPDSRAECKYGYRPCPYVRCRYHLYLEVKNNGAISGNFKGEVCELADSCALDISEREHHTLDQVGEYLNLTRERVRQIESDALKKLKNSGLPISEFFECIGSDSTAIVAYMDYIKN